ncbi:hypothetical protein LTR85_012253 [Meristemomyces frigidus]|nr:hypothetical protein LTR85_012253 [Meristemomyces frigidus]
MAFESSETRSKYRKFLASNIVVLAAQMVQASTKGVRKNAIDALSKIMDDMKSIAAVEEVKTVIHEAAEVGQTAAATPKDTRTQGSNLAWIWR